jgi:hypothetical protein
MSMIRETIISALLTLSVTAAAATIWQAPAAASDNCTTVESMSWVTPANGSAAQLVAWSKTGAAIVPPGVSLRESSDDAMHVCTQYDPFGAMEAIYLFMPRVVQ